MTENQNGNDTKIIYALVTEEEQEYRSKILKEHGIAYKIYGCRGLPLICYCLYCNEDEVPETFSWGMMKGKV